MSIWEELTSKFLKKRLQQEPTPLLDRAHYLAVSTGRIDPYLRALASVRVYIDASSTNLLSSTASSRLANLASSSPGSIDSSPGSVSPQNIQSLSCWATSRRALTVEHSLVNNAHQGQVGPKDVRGSKLRRLRNLRLQEISFPELLACQGEEIAEILVDPGLATELTIERKYFDTILDLAAGKAIPSALTAIGNEDISFYPPPANKEDLPEINPQETANAYKDLASYASTLAEDFTPMLMLVSLCGIGGKTFPCFMLGNSNEEYASLPLDYDQQFHRAHPSCLLLNPANPNWVRDICWESRKQALPTSTINWLK